MLNIYCAKNIRWIPAASIIYYLKLMYCPNCDPIGANNLTTCNVSKDVSATLLPTAPRTNTTSVSMRCKKAFHLQLADSSIASQH